MTYKVVKFMVSELVVSFGNKPMGSKSIMFLLCDVHVLMCELCLLIEDLDLHLLSFDVFGLVSRIVKLPRTLLTPQPPFNSAQIARAFEIMATTLHKKSTTIAPQHQAALA
ncbi:hypothetical protein AAZX31_18G141200 [Glycine max]